MGDHFSREYGKLQHRLLTLFGVAEQMINDATLALRNRDAHLATRVLDSDQRVDAEEVMIEEECLKLLALYQPVNESLRMVAAILKLNSDLERIADLACNVAKKSIKLRDFPYFPVPDQLTLISRESTEMVRKALNAFVGQNLALSKQVIFGDAVVDRLNREIVGELKALMKADGDLIEPALLCMSVSRHFERIADHAENIAEDVIYMISGEIIRHRHGDFEIEEAVNVIR